MKLESFGSRIIILSLYLSVLFLSFYGLGRNSLWHDESEVAVIGRNILKFGIPVVWDGHSFLPIAHDSSFHSLSPPYLFKLQTWLMFYIAGFGMWILGPTIFAVRFPFVIIGLLSIYLFYKLTKFITTSVEISVIATLLISYSVQFLILIRQARYYSLVIFFSLLATYSFVRYCFTKSHPKYNKFLVLFFASMLGLFHSHYLSFYAMFVGYFFFFSYFYGLRRTRLKIVQFITHPFIVAFFLLILATTPWLLFVRGYFPSSPLQLRALFQVPNSFVELVKKINRQVPFLLFGLGTYYTFSLKRIRSSTRRMKYIFLLIVIFSCIFAVAVTTSLRLPPSVHAEFRYTLAVFPLFFIFVAIVIDKAIKTSKFLGSFLLLGVLFTNIFSLPIESIVKEDYWPLTSSRLAVRSYIWEYIIYELLQGYIGPVDAIVNYIQPRMRSGDAVFASSEGVSLMFALPHLQVDNDYSLQRREGRDILVNDLLRYRWIIFRDVCFIECIFRDERALSVETILEQNYNRVELSVFDYIVQNREEIPYHNFRTVDYEPRVVIYERKEGFNTGKI